MGAGGRQELYYSTWFSVQSGLDEAIVIKPDGSVQEIHLSRLKVIIDSFLTLKLNGGVELVQEVNKLQKLLLRTPPEEN